MNVSAAMASAFVHVGRDLEFKPKGGAYAPIFGVLRKPTTDELAGGLDRDRRVFIVRALELVGLTGTPGKHDQVRDPDSGRVYVVQQGEFTYSGPQRQFWIGEVSG